MYEKVELVNEAHCNVNLFWISSAVPLFILILHFLRELCYPTKYSRKLLLLYKYDSDIQPPKQPQPFIYDSGRRHDNATGKAVEKIRSNSGDEEIKTVFENEDVTLMAKKPGLLVVKSPWAFRSDKLQIPGIPLASERFFKEVLVGFLWGTQLAIYRRAGLEAVALAKSCRSAKQTAILGFTGSMVFMLLSCVLSIDSIRAFKNSSDDARWWVRKPMGLLIIGGLIYLPVPLFRLLFA